MSEVIKAHDKSTEERNGAKGNGAARAVLVSANALAAHLCCVRSYIGCGADAVANEAVLQVFDLIEHDGDDLRRLPLIERKRRLARLIGKTKRRAIRFTEHLTGDGPTVFEHVCRMGLEGIVSKGTDAPYRSGKKVWVQVEELCARDGAPGARGEWR